MSDVIVPKVSPVDMSSVVKAAQHDSGKRADEAEPIGYEDVRCTADDDTCEQLDQRDREAELDRDRRGEQDGSGQGPLQVRGRSPHSPSREWSRS